MKGKKVYQIPYLLSIFIDRTKDLSSECLQFVRIINLSKKNTNISRNALQNVGRQEDEWELKNLVRVKSFFKNKLQDFKKLKIARMYEYLIDTIDSDDSLKKKQTQKRLDYFKKTMNGLFSEIVKEHGPVMISDIFEILKKKEKAIKGKRMTILVRENWDSCRKEYDKIKPN